MSDLQIERAGQYFELVRHGPLMGTGDLIGAKLGWSYPVQKNQFRFQRVNELWFETPWIVVGPAWHLYGAMWPKMPRSYCRLMEGAIIAAESQHWLRHTVNERCLAIAALVMEAERELDAEEFKDRAHLAARLRSLHDELAPEPEK